MMFGQVLVVVGGIGVIGVVFYDYLVFWVLLEEFGQLLDVVYGVGFQVGFVEIEQNVVEGYYGVV